MQRCYACFGKYEDQFTLCPWCGREVIHGPKEPVYLAPGTLVGDRYLIGEALGAGGFGIVYKALDTRLETVVAVKEFFVSRIMTRAAGEKQVIVTKKSQEEFRYRRERFLAEARHMAKFSTHRSIPNVYEFFEENDTAYIVMELLEGQTLTEYMADKSHTMTRELALEITREVGLALQALHGEGIIHRDVAPDNIFICEGQERRIKLMDLGAARLADSSDEVIDIILKPGYSPPEQYDNTKTIGPWTDVYALGASLYLMLTGRKPEESTNRKIGDSLAEPMALNPEIPENLNNAVLRAMAVDRHLRFQKVEEFLAALGSEKKVRTPEQEKKRRSRKRLLSVLAACLVLAALCLGVWHYYNVKNAAVKLKPASISLWFPLEEGSGREKAMSAAAADFMEKHPGVTVELKAFPADIYEAEIEAAAAAGRMPHLFYSSGASAAVLEKAADASGVLQSQQAAECLFLEQARSYYGETVKQIPLGIELPLACVITGGPVSLQYDKAYFSKLSDFGALSGEQVVLLPEDKSLLEKNLGEAAGQASGNRAAFYDNSANTSPLLLTGSMAINGIRSELTNYSKEFVFYDAEKIYGRFVYEWSLGPGTEAEMAAARRLLEWMLGSVYQNTLMISEASDGELPVNRTCFETKLENRILAPLKEIYGKLVFER